MFEINPKLLLFIPASVIFYKLLSQKEEVNVQSIDQKKIISNIKKTDDIKRIEYFLKKQKEEIKKKLLKIMKDEILEREIKSMLNGMIDQVIINVEKEKLEKEKLEKEKLEKEKLGLLASCSYLSYFNISKYMKRSNDFGKIDLSSDDSYEII